MGRLVLKVYQMLGLIKVDCTDKDKELSTGTNCTLINLALKLVGPTHEKNLAAYLLALQVCYFIDFFPFLLSVILNYDMYSGCLQYVGIRHKVSVGEFVLRLLKFLKTLLNSSKIHGISGKGVLALCSIDYVRVRNISIIRIASFQLKRN